MLILRTSNVTWAVGHYAPQLSPGLPAEFVALARFATFALACRFYRYLVAGANLTENEKQEMEIL